jgi:general secretion pathway protein I
MMPPHADAGFTLIESLVALVILAVSAVSLLAAAEAHVARIGALEARALAQFAAENALAELELGLEPADGPIDMAGRAFRVEVEREPTADPELDRVDLAVTDVATATTYRGFTGFVERPATR